MTVYANINGIPNLCVTGVNSFVAGTLAPLLQIGVYATCLPANAFQRVDFPDARSFIQSKNIEDVLLD